MKHAALLGCPLGHSLSPQLHQKLARRLGVDLDYQLKAIPPEVLEDAKEELLALDGFNITIPYKLRIMDWMDRLDSSAQTHGSVNVMVKQQGEYVGYNTDCIGFVRALEAAGVPIAGEVCIVGLGGVGRMFATECALRGCKLTIALRPERLQSLRQGQEPKLEALGQKLEGLSGQALTFVSSAELPGCYDLLINGSPVGMFPRVEDCPVPPESLRQVKAVFDCIYNPRQTKLLQAAQAAGCRCVGGMAMLVWQGAAAQELWFGKTFAPGAVEEVLREMEEAF